MSQEHLSPHDVGDTMEAFIRSVLEQSGAMPTVELATFSGSDKDWRKDDNGVYLRLQASRLMDGNGNPHELWARLFAPSNLWHIPTEKTEVLLLVAPHLHSLPAAGWCMWGTQRPPAKLSQGKAFQVFGDAVKYLLRAGGMAMRFANGTTLLGVDMATGEFSITLGGRSYLKFHPTGVEGMPLFEVAIVDTQDRVRTAFKVSAAGVEWMTNDPDAVGAKQTVKYGKDGSLAAVGTKDARHGWARNTFGPGTAGTGVVVPVATTGGVAGSTTFMTP